MTNESGVDGSGKNEAGKDQPQPARRELLPLPGLAAISLYLF
jgi:hypothetical protein